MMQIRWLFYGAVPLALIFVLFPEIDLEISGMFYDAARGGFYLKEQPVLYFIFKAVNYSSRVLIGYFVINFLLNIIFKKKFLLDNKQILFLSLALIIGPGLLTHQVLKNNWHRARPSQIWDFGKDKTFSPAFVITDQCEKNCSFTSGHAAMGFYFTAFALLLKSRKKRIAYACLIALGSLIGIARVLQGQHFLSDIIFGGIFTLIVIHASYLLVYHKKFEHINADEAKAN